MGAIKTLGRKAWRKYNVDGVQSSGFNKPDHSEIFQFVDAVDAGLSSVASGISVGNAVVYATRSELFADLAHTAGKLGVVYNDSTDAYNGIYIKSGSSGSGSWALTNLTVPSAFAADLAAAVAAAALKADKAITINAGGLASGGGDLSANRTITVTESSPTQAAEGLDDTTVLTPRRATSFFNGRTNSFSRTFLESASSQMTARRHLGYPALGWRAPYEDFDDDEEVVFVDHVNRVFMSFTKGGIISANGIPSGGGGQPSVNIEFAGEAPFIDAGVLKAVGPAGVYTVMDPTEPEWAFSRSASDANGAIQTAWDRPSIAAETSVRVEVGSPASPLVVPSPKRLLIVVPSYGQSLSVGAQGVPLLAATTTPTHPETILMFDGTGIDVRMGLDAAAVEVTALNPADLTGFQPLVSMTKSTRGVTLAEGLGYHMAKAVEDRVHFNPRHLFFAAGWGGKTYNGIRKTTQPYANLMAAVARAKVLAEAEGWQVWVPCIAFEHGQSDNGNVNYQTDIETLQADIEADIKAITGQVGDIPFLLSQPSSFLDTAHHGALGIYRAAKANREKFCLIGPEYCVPYASDLLHLNNVGNLKIGEYFAKAYMRNIFGMPKPSAVYPTNISAAGSQIDITFAVPSGALTLDTSLITNPGNYGFAVADDDGAVAISSVELLGGDGVRITTATAPGAGRKVSYGMTGYADPKVAGQGPRGNLRDMDQTPSIYDGQPLYNWCVHFEESF